MNNYGIDMGDLVSIIVPVYNTADCLKDCVNSIVTQTYKNIEIILVDDGSTDYSPKLCDDYASHDCRIRVIHQKNKGLPGARNSGLKVVKGDWVLFVDSDDWLVENAVELMMNEIDETCDLVLFNLEKTKLFDNNTINKKTYNVKKLSNKEINDLLNDSFDPMYEILQFMHRNKISACTKLYRISFIKLNELFFYEEVKVHEDIPYAVKVYSKAKSIIYIDAVLYKYRYNPNSITNSYRPNYSNELISLLNRMELISSELGNDFETLRMLNDRKIASAINLLFKCYCHKANTASYKLRKRDYKCWCQTMRIFDILRIVDISKYQRKKKLATILLKINMFWLLNITIKFYWTFREYYEKNKNICGLSSTIS